MFYINDTNRKLWQDAARLYGINPDHCRSDVWLAYQVLAAEEWDFRDR